MLKIVKTVWTLLVVLVMFGVGVLVADKYTLSTQLIRLRVVADSDRPEDQKIKLQVRDAVNEYLTKNMPQEITVQEAKVYLNDHTDQLRTIAQETLHRLGCEDSVNVYMNREAAQTRCYKNFSLPAGVYDTLRVDIGDASGQNWWCVVFPSLCATESVIGVKETAIACGISENLSDTLVGDGSYQVRFFILDCLGKLENLLFNA